MAEHEFKQCPECGYRFDNTSYMRNSGKTDPNTRPSPGDVTVCFGCASVLAWTENNNVRRADLNDLLKLTNEQRALIGRIAQAIKHIKKTEGKELSHGR